MWHELLRRETAPGDSVVNISWPARTAAPLLRAERLPDQIRRPQPTPITEPRADVPIAAKADLVCSVEARSAPAPYAPVPELAMGTGSIEQRYPLLRNTM
jgi:hypothetical protein